MSQLTRLVIMEQINEYVELVGSRMYDKATKKANLTDEHQRILSALIQANVSKDEDASSSLYRMRAFCNMDAGSDQETLPAGIMTLHDPKSYVSPEMITESLFEYFVVTPIEHPKDLGQEYDDAFFQTDEKRAALNEAVPQYGGNPYSIVLHRSRRDNSDIRAWEAELGQDNAWAGVIKSIHENGEDCDYWAAVRSGSPVACQEIKQMVAKAADSGKPMTWKDFELRDEVSAALANAKNNACRLAFNVALACGVGIEAGPDNLAHGKTKPSMADGVVLMAQPLSTVELVTTHKEKRAVDGQCIGLFNEVTPKHKMPQNYFFVLSNGAGPTLQFDTTKFKPSDMGIPCTTGRNAPLPPTAQDANARVANGDERIKQRYAKGAKRFVWEDRDTLQYHPDMHPESHYSPLPRRDPALMDQMCELGWNRRGFYTTFYPVLVKLSNPYMKRPASHAKQTPQQQANTMAEFD